jgi:hypothetical protein
VMMAVNKGRLFPEFYSCLHNRSIFPQVVYTTRVFYKGGF